MPSTESYECRCLHCLHVEESPEKVVHRQMNLFLSRLDEQQRRWYVALESKKLGHGGDKQMSLMTGMHVETIRRELVAIHKQHPKKQERQTKKKQPTKKKKTNKKSRA